MAKHDIITIGASAGGVEAILELTPQLPADLPAALFVVIHISSQSDHVLPRLLDRRSNLRAASAVDGEPVEHGRIYIAPPDHHLLVKQEHVRVVRGPQENRHRPAVDPLFRSAAVAYGPRVIGVILSGSLDDGTAGLRAIKRCGGTAVVQDPDDALFPGMPRSAIGHVQVDYRLPLAEFAPLLTKLVHEEAAAAVPMAEDVLIAGN